MFFLMSAYGYITLKRNGVMGLCEQGKARLLGTVQASLKAASKAQSCNLQLYST